MSASPQAAHAGSHGSSDEPHGTMRGYVIGFLASVVLTVIPFWLVMADVTGSPLVTALLVMELGVMQILVHMYYFLHMNTSSQGGWTMMALIFTVVLVLITLIGSMWVMHHLTAHMMPHAMPSMPMPGEQLPGQTVPAAPVPHAH
jgi:cytochrome o ubiquinol oxidase operon protein cyoD